MLRSITLVSFIVLSLTEEVLAEWCYYGTSVYYCSSGQSCGSYYNDCRGLPTYAIVGIVGISVAILSICIRCCVQLNSNNARQVPPRAPISIQNPGHVRVQVFSAGNNRATRTPTTAPVHCIREDAPPSYAAAISSTTEPPKY
ncbi:unnamed protein product [Rotaria sp. Silwood1]|nr:unnamed protein product [Rotaria sp. Silwood1]CAF1242367.1 unnamed protein product [Rotaria sp. Silwood1]CAF3501051.1 unnamed protein product [Rotaria sp. Silwood1]CAF4752066.1 unnamed protein product [Rotaria sp. Silwood1]CAF4835333.1 unnamed protein product [Rotaria sp. Silwood1]